MLETAAADLDAVLATMVDLCHAYQGGGERMHAIRNHVCALLFRAQRLETCLTYIHEPEDAQDGNGNGETKGEVFHARI